MSDFSHILNAIEQGNVKAADEFLSLVYEELRLLAAQKLSHEQPGQTLWAKALVHEAYIRLIGEEFQDWKKSRHFFRAAAEAIRRIIIDNARHEKSLKRGGKHQRMGFNNIAPGFEEGCSTDDLIALDDALRKLAQQDETKAEVVKLRYFAGLSIEQTAEILGISATTTKFLWAYTRGWLLLESGELSFLPE